MVITRLRSQILKSLEETAQKDPATFSGTSLVCRENDPAPPPRHCENCLETVSYTEVEASFYRQFGFKRLVRPFCACEQAARDGEKKRRRAEFRLQQRIARIIELQAKCGLGTRFMNRTFGQFNPPEEDAEVFEVVLEYAENFTEQTENGLWLWSTEENGINGCGNGKTHLAASVMNRVLNRGIPALFITGSRFLDLHREACDSRTENRELIEELRRVPLLVLDDLGKEHMTEWGAAKLFDLVNERYEAAKPLLLTSNMDAASLADHLGAHHGTATVDRLLEIVGTTGYLKFRAPSWRIR